MRPIRRVALDLCRPGNLGATTLRCPPSVLTISRSGQLWEVAKFCSISPCPCGSRATVVVGVPGDDVHACIPLGVEVQVVLDYLGLGGSNAPFPLRVPTSEGVASGRRWRSSQLSNGIALDHLHCLDQCVAIVELNSAIFSGLWVPVGVVCHVFCNDGFLVNLPSTIRGSKPSN